MQDIIKEYGPAIITVVVIGALIVLLRALIGDGEESSIVGDAFSSLITNFFNNANTVIEATPIE